MAWNNDRRCLGCNTPYANCYVHCPNSPREFSPCGGEEIKAPATEQQEKSYCDDCRCNSCEHQDNCELSYLTEFCEDCKHYPECTIRFCVCPAGHEIECNNGFEPKYDLADDESEAEE